jgi:hypothetical protein
VLTTTRGVRPAPDVVEDIGGDIGDAIGGHVPDGPGLPKPS